MRCYGHSYRDTMNLPIPVFWQLSGTVPRLLAGEHRDTLELLVTAQNLGGASEKFKALDQAAPDPVKLTGKGIIAMTPAPDKSGLGRLKNMAS